MPRRRCCSKLCIASYPDTNGDPRTSPPACLCKRERNPLKNGYVLSNAPTDRTPAGNGTHIDEKARVAT